MPAKKGIHHLRNRIWLVAGIFILLIVLFGLYVQAENAQTEAMNARFVSFNLAKELRQSSDDLSRMVRTYIITGNPIYKDHYQEILDIRNGLKAKPQNYEDAYWDLNLSNEQQPRKKMDGHESLLERIKNAGVTPQEFDRLAQSKAQSDALTKIEFDAMKMVETEPGADEKVRFQAILTLTDEAYHKAKANIVQPINEFMRMVQIRTAKEIADRQTITVIIRTVFISLGLLMFWMLLTIYRSMQKTLGAPLDLLHRQITELGSGNFSTTIKAAPGMENSILGWLSQMQLNLAELESARRNVEEKLEATTQRMVNIINATQVGTWERNMQTGTMLLNERWASMLGYTLAELEPISNLTFNRLVHPDDEEQAEILKQLHFQNKISVYESKIRMQHKDGHWVWILTRGSLLSRTADGEPEWMAGSHLDISALEKANTRLRDNEQQMRMMLNEMPIGVALVNKSGKIFFRNKYLIRLLGYTDIDIPDLNAWWTVAFPDPAYRADSRQIWNDALASAVTDKEIIASHTYALQTLHGERVEVEISGIPVAFGFLATMVDQTENRRIQEQLHEAKTAAETASQAKSTFLATMSHEIRTPMNGMLGMLKLLSQTKLSTQQLDYAKKAENATRALLSIINNILDFSKIEAGKFELDRTSFILTDLLGDLSTVLSSNLSSKHVEVLFSLDPHIPPLLIGDPLRLRQILLNLTGNAIKFTEKGEVVLSVTLISRTKTAAGNDAVNLEFSVQDTGIGIEAEKLDSIFDSFNQAESSTARRFGGTGLGLSITKQLLTMMGSEIQVNSNVGQGSRFYFALTLEVASQDESTDTEMPAQRQPPERLNLLIVDDNATSREVLTAMADSLNWSSQTASSGEQALEMLSQSGTARYDAILMDWRMPGMDGWDTTRKIRALHDGKYQPVVVMVTAHGLEFFNEKSKEDTSLVIDGYLFKPITATMLFDAVGEARDAREVDRPKYKKSVSGTRNLVGKRILVVEDNRLNQQIAKELLELNGAQVEIASNGLNGVKQALASRPHVILMDIQMPDIDGLEATRRIRSHADMLATPIIAMTANAMESDRAACLEAGMVDHVAKPIELELLIKTIQKHTSAAALTEMQTDFAQGKLFPDAVGPGPMVDVEEAISRLGGNRQFYEKIIYAVRTDGPAQLAELKHCLAQNNADAAARAMHTFKGLVATLGAESLAQLAASTERLIRQTGTETGHELHLAERIEEIETMLQRVLDELSDKVSDPGRNTRQIAIKAQENSYAEAGQRRASLRQELTELMEALRTNNMRSVAICSQIRHEHSNWLNIKELDLLLNIDETVNQLNFTNAQSLCKQLLELINA